MFSTRKQGFTIYKAGMIPPELLRFINADSLLLNVDGGCDALLPVDASTMLPGSILYSKDNKHVGVYIGYYNDGNGTEYEHAVIQNDVQLNCFGYGISITRRIN